MAGEWFGQWPFAQQAQTPTAKQRNGSPCTSHCQPWPASTPTTSTHPTTATPPLTRVQHAEQDAAQEAEDEEGDQEHGAAQHRSVDAGGGLQPAAAVGQVVRAAGHEGPRARQQEGGQLDDQGGEPGGRGWGRREVARLGLFAEGGGGGGRRGSQSQGSAELAEPAPEANRIPTPQEHWAGRSPDGGCKGVEEVAHKQVGDVAASRQERLARDGHHHGGKLAAGRGGGSEARFLRRCRIAEKGGKGLMPQACILERLANAGWLRHSQLLAAMPTGTTSGGLASTARSREVLHDRPHELRQAHQAHLDEAHLPVVLLSPAESRECHHARSQKAFNLQLSTCRFGKISRAIPCPNRA